MTAPDPNPSARSLPPWLRYLPLALLLAAGVVIFASGLYRQISLANAMAHREALLQVVETAPFRAFAIYIAVYAAAIVFAVPGAVVFTMFGGFLFGALGGALAGILGSTIGGAIVVLIGSASLGMTLAQSALPRFQKLARGFREGAFGYIVLMRLIPLVPYVAINIGSALFRVPLSTFMLATAIGIAPIALCFGFIGSGLDRGFEKQAELLRACQADGRDDCSFDLDPMHFLSAEMIAGLALLSILALLPIIFRKRLAKFHIRTSENRVNP